MVFIAALRRSQLASIRPLIRSLPNTVLNLQSVRLHVCQRLASTASKAVPKDTPANGIKYKYPEELQLFHAGVSRITFLACVKLSTILIFTFFTFVVTPRYYAKEGWSTTTIRTALSGVVPLVFVAWTTSPFVLLVSTKLPPFARTSEQHLKRYLSRLPADAKLDITTMSLIAKPRLSRVQVSEIQPTSKRLGIVNFTRDTAAENQRRKWYHFRAVGKFSIQNNKTKANLWSWDLVDKSIKSNN